MRFRRLRTLLRILRRTALAMLAGLALYVLLALLLPRIPVHSDYRPIPETAGHGGPLADPVLIFVESNGVHTDFALPVRSAWIDWAQHLPTHWFERVDADFEYLAFGWGDKGFYLETPTWADLKVSTAFQATFFLGSTAMHVTYLWRAPVPNERCRPLRITAEQYQELIEFLLSSFERDADGRLRLIDAKGYTPYDRFFEANGTYSFIHTCNAWTGRGLDRMRVKTGLWTPFAWDVLRYLEN